MPREKGSEGEERSESSLHVGQMSRFVQTQNVKLKHVSRSKCWRVEDESKDVEYTDSAV
jgi:hypothetical protein